MVAPLIKPVIDWVKKVVTEIRLFKYSTNSNHTSLVQLTTTLLGTGIGPANSFFKIEDNTAGTDLTNVRALVFLSNGTVTLTDNTGHVEVNIPITAPLTLVGRFTYIEDINCTVYAMS